MRKLSFYIAALLTAVLLTACGQQKQAVETGQAPADILEAVIASQTSLPAFIQISAGDEEFDSFLSDYYLLEPGQISGGVICYADGAVASEIAVLVLVDESYAETAEEALAVYMENRAGVFEGYAPQQAALAKSGTVVTNGKYAALLMCPDTSAAKTAFLSCFGESGQASAPIEMDSVYDGTAVLRAWTSGDPSTLSERNLAIFNAAKDVIDENTNSRMSGYEKELAIHDWITGWSSFSMSAFSRAPGSGDERDADTPYGVLVNQSGNCWGYSSTFQLFMDMLDIECITVYGTPSSSGVEHAWNMVRLDDEWYCVDTAWDDPIGGSPEHRYFNRTSEEFRNSGIHHWDESAVPEATGTTYRYGV